MRKELGVRYVLEGSAQRGPPPDEHRKTVIEARGLFDRGLQIDWSAPLWVDRIRLRY
jgi:hypothetical protein